MFDANSKMFENRAEPEPTQLQQLLSFLDVSARCDLSGTEVHDHLLMSLAFALTSGTSRN